jgi:hypothetical protein
VKIYGCVWASCGYGMGTGMAISLKDMIAELRRELRHRQTIYPTLIKRGALTEAAADRQNARLQAALDVLVSLEEIDAARLRAAGRSGPRALGSRVPVMIRQQALNVICYLRGNASPDLRAACQRVIVRGDGADPADLGILAAEVERRATPRCGGAASLCLRAICTRSIPIMHSGD